MSDTSTHSPATFAATIILPLAKNPLSLNGRDHWRTKAKHTKQWRTFTALQAARFPELGRCDVTLTWVVRDRRDRDEDNLYPLLKACCDGLVDAGVVIKDTADYMGKTCRIERRDVPVAFMELRVESRNLQPTL